MTASPTPDDAALGTGAVDIAALHRRGLRVLMASQLLGGAGLAAGGTVGALLAEDMLGSTRLRWKTTQIYEGTNQIQRMVITRSLPG